MQPKEKVMTFQKGQGGNPAGRPRGSRNRATRLGYSLLEKELAMVTSRSSSSAYARIVPIQRGSCELPPLGQGCGLDHTHFLGFPLANAPSS
jgi:hypothetical protein